MGHIRRHLTYANVISTLCLFLLLGGGTALAAYVVSSNSQIGPGTVSGHKPPSGDHANIIAGSVNGQDVADNSSTGADINESSLTGNVRKLIYDSPVSGGPTKIATVGGYTLKGECFNDAGSVGLHVVANGPAGLANIMSDWTEDDTRDIGNHSSGIVIPASTDTVLLQFEANPGHFLREGGTAMLKSGSTLVEVEFNAVADARPNHPCFLYGTATRAT
jgi:hypothetical protein